MKYFNLCKIAHILEFEVGSSIYQCALDKTREYCSLQNKNCSDYVLGEDESMFLLNRPCKVPPIHESWEEVRLAAVDCLNKQQVSDSVCTCSSHAVFLYGCPSTKGKPCPSRQ